MAQAINAPLNVQVQNGRQLTQQVQASLNAVRLNLGNGKALSSLSQPLGRLTGQADEFTKSLDAANARVLAFGASVGIVNAFSNAFKSLVNSTIEVEKAIKAISVVGDQFNGKTKQLTQGLFNVAKVTGQSFAEVSKAALEFSRQGQNVEETLRRTQDALILTRLTGLDAAKAVEGLTAAANGFTKAGLNTTQILNKLVAVDQAFAVSSADLIEGFNRSSAVAENAGVTFDELAGIITALQQKTSRGGAVIGNALKTIFTRLQDTSTLNQLQGLGIAVQDLQGNLLPARQILQNLAKDVEGLGQITKAGIFKDVAGAFQINQLISLVNDLNSQNSIAADATRKSTGATNEAFLANEKLSQSLDAIINKVSLTGQQLGSLIGELGLSDSFKSILDGINGFLEGATNLLQGDDLGAKFAKGIVKGIGAVLTGPGLGIFLAVIGKLTLDLVKFGSQSVKAFFGIGQAAKQQQQIQESIVQTLLRNENVLRTILNTQGGQNAQAQAFLGILNQQEKALQNIRSLAGGIAAPVIAAGYSVGSEGGIQRRGRAAGGYLPAQEASDVRRGVGGASPNSKVVSIPNFAFGGGKRGTMIANTSEYIVPNYAGGGSAIFNQDMVKTMGLPAGAKKISAAGGYVPNFADSNFTNDQLAVLGLYGNTGGDINGSPIYTLQSQRPDISRDISFEYAVRVKKMVRDYAKQIASKIPGLQVTPKSIQKAVQQKDNVSGFIFEDVMNQLAGPYFDSNKISGGSRADFPLTKNLRNVFNVIGAQKYAEVKLNPYSGSSRKSVAEKQKALADGATPPRELTPLELAGRAQLREDYLTYQSLASRAKDPNEYRRIVNALELNPTTQRETLNNQIETALGLRSSPNKRMIGGVARMRSASGYVPNFAASALQEAIAREKNAGLSSSQIYVDQSSVLKSASNPMGLMVANTRDEPSGGFQGIARARKEGANPRLYGAAKGFVPNYASQQASSSTPNVAKVEKGFGDIVGKLIIFQSALSFFESGFTEVGSTTNKVTEGLQTLTTTVFAYQAIQQLTNKNENKQSNQIIQNTSRLKKFGESLKKFADDFAKGGGSRARIVSMGGRLPSSTAFGTRLSAGLGTSRFAEGIRGAVGNPIGALKSIGALAAAGAVALKGFNDLAGLFYTRSSKLDSSLELLSSSAGKAAASLNDVDKASLKGATSALRTVGFGATLTKFLAGFNPANLGKEKVAYNYGGSATISSLKGGQTQEDFVKVQEDLSSLIFTNLKTQYKDAPNVSIKNETQSKVASLFKEATQDGVLDLEKLFNLPVIQELVKNASDTNKKIDRIAAEAESKKAFPKLVESVEKIIAGTNTAFNNEINKINDFSEKIKAIQASKAFGNLNFENQLSINLSASTKEFENSFRQRQIDIVKNAQELIKNNLPDIVEGEDFNIGPETQEKIKKASNLDEVLSLLEVFQQKLGGIDPTKIKGFVSQLNDFQNSISTFKSNLDTRSATLKLEQEELIATTKAQIEFRDKFIAFSNSVGDAQRSLINLRGALERIDVQTQSRIDIRSAFATSRQQQLDIRKEETLSGLSKKQGAEATINLQEALIEARKQSFTEENFIALNLNTQAIKDLTTELLKSQGTDFQTKYNETEKAINNIVSKRMSEGITSEDARKEALAFKISGSPLNLGEQLNYYQNSLNLTSPNQKLIQGSDASGIAEKIFASNSPIGNFAQSSNTLQEFIDKTAQEFSLNEQAVLRIRPQLLNIYDSVKGQAVTASEALATEREKLKANQDLLDSTNNYRQSISAALLDLETRLATEPMSSGQFAAGQRASRIATEEERRFETGGDAAVREYRSSFGRGFEEALGPIEEKTLDFKNEIGREIPNLFASNLAQGLNDAISGAKSLKDALRDAATSFLNAITQKNVENIANLVTGGVGNVAQSFFASGGQVNGGSGVKDDVPAMLMGGEYVIRKSAVKKYGSKFLDSLNNGGIKAFAKGGGVQSGRGGFYVPGDYGEGAITGKGQLLAFAGQSFTGGQYDQVGVSGMSGASINLESESARLTAFGRENSPMFERIQQAKEEAFNVYLNQLKQEEQYKEQLKQIEEAEKARKKQLTTAIVSAVVSSALSYGTSKLGQRFNTGKVNAQVDALNYGPQTSAALSSIGNSAGFRNMVAGAPLTSAAQTYSQGIQTNFAEPMLPVAGGSSNELLPNADYIQKDLFSEIDKRYRANGGAIFGGSGIRDDVPAMLTGGEFVLNNRATRKLGVENLNRLNSGDVGGNSGQQVSEAVVSKLDELIKTTRESSKNNVVVNVSGMEGGMENKEKRADENKSNTEKELQRKIRDAVLAVLAQEKRLGGSLSK